MKNTPNIKRVVLPFSKTDCQDFAKNYLDKLYSNWKIAADKQGRAMTTILLLILAFELITRAVISEVSLGPFKLTDLSIIHKLLPAFLAYYYFEFRSWGTKRLEISDIYYEIIETCYPSISTIPSPLMAKKDEI